MIDRMYSIAPGLHGICCRATGIDMNRIQGMKHESVALGSSDITGAALSFCRRSDMSAAELTAQTPLPAAFLRFIGVMEILGGLGLVLPGMLRIRTALTPLAAAGLTIIMIGALVVTIQTLCLGPAALPFVTGALAIFVAYGRWRLAPLGAKPASDKAFA
jgi:hypothetical protein